MGLNLKESAALATIVIGLSIAGAKVTESSGPGPRPEYSAGPEEVNKKVNNVLIGGAERACLTTGRIDGEKFKKERKDILGNKEGDVRALCAQVRNKSDRVFTLQIMDSTRYTRDGNIYFPTGNIVPVKDQE